MKNKFIIKENLLGYEIFSGHKKDCINSIVSWINNGNRCKYLACINPHSYVVSLKDNKFYSSLSKATWLIPDGFGIVLGSRFLGGVIRRRITGSDIFSELSYALNSSKLRYKIFLLGSTNDTLIKLSNKLKIDYPNIDIVGYFSPPFKDEFSVKDNNNMIGIINNAAPEILWVSMSAPKQEKWLFQNTNKLNIKFAAGVGATFDFYIGNIYRSPKIFQNIGLEWLPRLLQEPTRLWRRTFISTPIFLLNLILFKFKKLFSF